MSTKTPMPMTANVPINNKATEAPAMPVPAGPPVAVVPLGGKVANLPATESPIDALPTTISAKQEYDAHSFARNRGELDASEYEK